MIEESTSAALKHLNDLYQKFNNWTLALAAYNCGAGNVNKAISKSGGSTDFWTLMKYLPSETRNYVPKFIAISYILDHYNEFGIKPIPLDEEYYDIAQAIVYKHMDFTYISKITGVSLEVIRNLNYAFRKDYIPANPQGYKLVLPKYALFELLNNEGYEQIEFDKELNENYKTFIVNYFPRDIASYMLENGIHYNIVNAIKNYKPDYITSIEERDPIGSPSIESKAYIPRDEDEEGVVYYTLKNGESLYDVSKKFDNISITDILRWNGYSINKLPKSGTTIKLFQ
ncbi:MAG: transglycosylase SLT domain-containing protein [Saprospiraceae bacterium]